MWDRTPWFVGGGAEHSPELARMVLFASTGGAEGIVTPSDLKVLAQSSPAGSVRVTPGAALLLNRHAGGGQQTYGARNPVEHVVSISPTAAGAGRSDLVIARVEDPQYAPWVAPADPLAAQYVFTRVIQNVPAGTVSAVGLNLGYPAIALARIDIPASTTAITAAMVKDVRRLAQPRQLREVRSLTPSAKAVLTTSFANTFNFGTVEVPAWATHMHLRGDVSGAVLTGATSNSEWRAGLSGIANTDAVATTSEQNRRITTFSSGTLAIPSANRGGTVNLVLQGRNSSSTGEWAVDTFSTGAIDVQFIERAE